MFHTEIQTLSQDSTLIRHQPCQKYIKNPSSHTHIACVCITVFDWPCLLLGLLLQHLAAFSTFFATVHFILPSDTLYSHSYECHWTPSHIMASVRVTYGSERSVTSFLPVILSLFKLTVHNRTKRLSGHLEMSQPKLQKRAQWQNLQHNHMMKYL